MLSIRPARLCEANRLTELAVKSEAHWGYGSDFMNEFRRVYSVTESSLARSHTYVALEDDAIVGFYSLLAGGKETTLECFYVDPHIIGRGYGRRLWEHMVDLCRTMGIRRVYMVTSPQAEGFYEKMGAAKIADVESLLQKGRMIPKLAFDLAE